MVRMKGLTSHVTVSRLSMSVCFLSVCECSDKSTQNSLMWRELELLYTLWFYQEVGQFQCVGNGSLFSHILCILLVHIELHKMCDLQTAGSHLIVCNSVFRISCCFTILCKNYSSTDSSWRECVDRIQSMPQHFPGAFIKSSCTRVQVSLLSLWLRNCVLTRHIF